MDKSNEGLRMPNDDWFTKCSSFIESLSKIDPKKKKVRSKPVFMNRPIMGSRQRPRQEMPTHIPINPLEQNNEDNINQASSSQNILPAVFENNFMVDPAINQQVIKPVFGKTPVKVMCFINML